MATYLLVGGSHDGERFDIDGEPPSSLKLPTNYSFQPPPTVTEIKKIGIFLTEIYRLESWRDEQGGDNHLYVAEHMSIRDTIMALFNFYQRPKITGP